MVLRPPLVGRPALRRAAIALVLAAACGKPTTGSTPPGSGSGSGSGGDTAEVEPPDAEPRPTLVYGDEPSPPSVGIEELYIDGVRLLLRSSECLLVAVTVGEEQLHRFEKFPGECHFAKDRDGQSWVVATDHGKAVLVESSVPKDAGNCDTALQVVVITEKGPMLSREVQRVSGCGPGPWDEMMVHVLASDRVAFGGE
jgi:hypothetical protein